MERVEISFAQKGDGRLRIVTDCRRANCWSADPPGVRLATGATLAGLELADDDGLYVGEGDPKDCFYHMDCQMPLGRFSF